MSSETRDGSMDSDKGMAPTLEELASSGSRLRNLLDAAPVGIVILKNRVLHWVNDQLVEMTGYPRAELVGSDARMLYADESEYARVGRVFYRAGEDRTQWVRADGRTIHVMIRSTRLDPDDESAGYAVAALDVSELELARQELEAGNQQLEALNQQLAAGEEELEAQVKDLEEYNSKLIQAQDAVCKLEREKTLILSSIPELVLFQDREHRLIWANKAAGESVNQPCESLIGQRCFDIWHGRSEPCEGCPVVDSLASGEITSGVVESPDGRIWSITGCPVRENDELIGAVEITRDITKTVLAQEVLTRHIEFEEMIIEISTRFINLPVESLDAEIERALKLLGEFNGVDRCYLFQYSEKMTIADNTHEWVGDGVRPEKDNLQGVDISGFKTMTETILKDEILNIPRVADLEPGADRDEFLREGIRSLLCVPMSAGETKIGFMGFDSVHGEKEWSDKAVNLLKVAAEIFANAIERRRRERTVQREKDRAQNYLDIAGVIMVALDHEGKITLINQRGARILGWSESEIIGMDWFENFLPTEIGPGVRQVFSQLLKGEVENVEYFENPVADRNGEERLIAWRNTLLHDDEGRIVGTLSSGEDITETRRAEEALRVKNMELEAALGVKTDFLSIVSHELRTPLVPILGYSELLLTGAMGELPERSLKALQTIRSRALALTAIIEDLLTLTRVERSAISIEPEPVSIRQRMELIINDYLSMDHGKEAALLLSGDDCLVMVDPARLDQVVRNLIDNAIKYSGPTVTVRIRIETRSDRCMIHISDNGIGIAEDHLPRIFDRFYQIEPADTRRHGGTGLGLAIVKEMVEIMDGEVRVSSKPGQGSTFTVSLKAAGPDCIPAKPAARPAPKPSRAEDGGALTVMVIDDDPFTLDIVRCFLEDNYNVIGAETGARGLDIAHRTAVDLILLDWMMPGMDGISVLRALKANDRTSAIPVLFISGKVESEYMDTALDCGAVGFVKKPFTRDGLRESIQRTHAR